MPTTLTRQELYDQVWAEPISKLAAKYDLSDQGLAKLCKRYKIPTPERGYWAKLAAKKPVRQVALPDAGLHVPDKIVIYPKAKVTRAPAPEVQKAIEAAPEVTISVPKTLVTPHPVVKAWVDERERELALNRSTRTVAGGYYIGSFTKPFTSLERRRLRILSTLFNYLEKQGYKCKAKNHKELELSYESITLPFTLEERLRQYRKPLTAEEKKQSWNAGREWRQVREPSGLLVFKLQVWLENALKTEWVETEAQSMEETLSDVARTILIAGPLLLQKERRKREEERIQYEAAMVRRRADELQRKDLAEWKAFVGLARDFNEALLAKALLQAMEKRKDEVPAGQDISGRSWSEWLTWAGEWIAQYDLATTDLALIFEEVSKAQPEPPKPDYLRGYGYR